MAAPNFDKGLKTSGLGYLARLRKPEPHFMVRWPRGGQGYGPAKGYPAL